MDAQLQADLNKVINNLKTLDPFLRKAGKADLREAAKILSTAVAIRTPIGKVTHRRYPTKKGKKAGKGSGNVLATYRPGNLRRSIRVLNFRRSSAAFVGAKLGKNPDGYYAHMVERGTTTQPAQEFFKKAIASAGNATLNKAIQLLSRRIQSYGVNNGFK
jgi:HK97 gp10 family phage protein